MGLSPECEAGCMSFDGGEVKHHRDCRHYPESLTRLWHDTEAEYLSRIKALTGGLRKLRLDICHHAQDTVWVGSGETAVDRISELLHDGDWYNEVYLKERPDG